MPKSPGRTDPGAPLVLQRNLILALLITLSALCWVVLYWQAQATDMAMMMSPVMGLSAPLFLVVWVVMMAAMMFPAAAPMIVTFHHLQSVNRRQGNSFVPTWIFVAGYMVVWTAAGAVAYCAAVAGGWLADWAAWDAAAIARLGGLMLILAGIYQLTPLKAYCLTKCQSPIGFIMTSWRAGNGGAFRMGVGHGAYCLGCCWLLFVIMFPLGMMNIAVMAVLSVLIFAEKTLTWGKGAAQLAALVLTAFGVMVLARPGLLPTYMNM
jgi:predicted metal-binding membrane protein